MIQITNSFRPPDLPKKLSIGDDCISVYAISHPTNIRVHNGKAYFNAHAEILKRLSSVCADLLSGDSECKEIPMLDISNAGIAMLEKLLYTDFDSLPFNSKPDEELAETMFLLITKYGFPESDLRYLFPCFVDVDTTETMQRWFFRCMEVPLLECANAIVEDHLDEYVVKDMIRKVWDYHLDFVLYYCNTIMDSCYTDEFRYLMCARAWKETKEGEYLMYTLDGINTLKVTIRNGVRMLADSYEVSEEDRDNLTVYEGELISALTWAERYVEDGSGKCELQKARVEEMQGLITSANESRLGYFTAATEFIFSLQSGKAT